MRLDQGQIGRPAGSREICGIPLDELSPRFLALQPIYVSFGSTLEMPLEVWRRWASKALGLVVGKQAARFLGRESRVRVSLTPAASRYRRGKTGDRRQDGRDFSSTGLRQGPMCGVC